MTGFPFHNVRLTGIRAIQRVALGVASFVLIVTAPIGPATGQTGGAGIISGSIEFEQVTEIDPGTFGLLTSVNGGFSASMWAGTSADFVAGMLPAIKPVADSPTIQALQGRLLVSEVLPPDGYRGGRDQRLLGLRLMALYRLGQTRSVERLATKAGIPIKDLEDVQADKAVVDVALLDGQLGKACAMSEGYAQSDDLFWLRLITYCQASAGDMAAAELTAGLLAELGGDNDLFDGLLDSLFADEKPGKEEITALIDSAPSFEALHLAMLRLAKLQIPVSAFDKAGPGLLAAVAADSSFHPVARLVAAEQGYRLGVVSAKSLGARYRGIKFSQSQLDGKDPLPAEIFPSVLQALFVQRVDRAKSRNGKIEAIGHALTRASLDGADSLIAHVLADELTKLSPATNRAGMAGVFGRAAFANGSFEKALRWEVVARRAGEKGDASAANGGLRIFPLIVLKGIGQGAQDSPKNIDNWVQGMLNQKVLSDEDRNRQLRLVGLVLGSLEALGHRIDAKSWAALAAAEVNVSAVGQAEGLSGVGSISAFAAWRGIVAASAGGRLGESLTLSFAALARDGLANCHPGLLASVVTALRQLGLDQDARTLAIEAVIAAGL